MACSCQKKKHKARFCLIRSGNQFYTLFSQGNRLLLLEITKETFKRLKQNGTKLCRDPQGPSKSTRQKPLLTNRERQVFELMVQDKTTKEIAAQLSVSEKTVRNHISNVMNKLNVKGRSQAVVELVRLGELQI